MFKNTANFSDKRLVAVDQAVFSIIIPSWNNLAFLKLCIHSIRSNSVYPHQIIVHINDGSDGTLEWIADQHDISYTHSGHNIGVCYALNSAAQLAATDQIVYLNDDMYVCPDWDLHLNDVIKRQPDILYFISSTAIEAFPQSNCSIRGDYGTTIETFNEHKLLAEYKSLPKTNWSGATWPPNLVHKQIWDLVGGYSTEFSPGFYSDPDFSMKLWNAGVRRFIGVADSRVYHFGSVSTRKNFVKNKGYHQFVSKWGMTAATLSKYYLHKGEILNGTLVEPQLPFWLNMKNYFKRMVAVFGQ